MKDEAYRPRELQSVATDPATGDAIILFKLEENARLLICLDRETVDTLRAKLGGKRQQ